MNNKPGATPQIRQDTPERRHEPRDINFRLVLSVLVLIFAAAFLIHGLLWLWLTELPRGTHQLFSSTWRVLSAEAERRKLPALQVNPGGDLLQFQRKQKHRLESYGWIDPRAGIIQLPIERAMQLIVEQGLPTWQPTSAHFEFLHRSDPSPNVYGAFLKGTAQVFAGEMLTNKAKEWYQTRDTIHKPPTTRLKGFAAQGEVKLEAEAEAIPEVAKATGIGKAIGLELLPGETNTTPVPVVSGTKMFQSGAEH